MNSQENTKQDVVSKHLDAIWKNLFKAKRAYLMWWFLCGEETRPVYVNTLNKYHHFFDSLIGFTFDTAIICLYKLTEPRPNTHNFDSLFNVLQNNSSIIRSDQLSVYKQEMKSHNCVIKGIQIIRNNDVGHTSLKMKYDEIFKKATITPKEIKALIEVLMSIYCEIRDILHGVKDAPSLETGPKSAQEELQALLDDLTRFQSRKAND